MLDKNNIIIVAVLIFLSGFNLFSQWEADTKLSTDEGSANTNENMGPCLVSSGDTVHVIWWDAKKDGSAIYYKRSTDNGTSWSDDLRLSGAKSSSDFPSIAVSGNYVHIVFRDHAGPKFTSYYQRSTDGGNTWEKSVFLDTTCWWPSVAACGPMVYVALNDTIDSNNSEVYFVRSTDNGTNWSARQRISNALGRSEDPSIAGDKQYVYISWNENRDGNMEIYYRRSSDRGSTWDPETRLTISPEHSYGVAVSAHGSYADIVWGDRRSGIYEIYHRYSGDNGLTFQPETELTRNSTTGNIYPFLDRDGENVHATWCGSGLYYSKSSDGGHTWSTDTALTGTETKAQRSFVSVSGAFVHLIWTDQRDGHSAVYYKRNPTGNLNVTNVFSSDTTQVGTVITPNPALGYIEINVPRWRGQGVENPPLEQGEHHSAMFTGGVTIFDVLGIEVNNSTLTPTLSLKGEGVRIDISLLSPGVYFVRIGDVVRKFVKI